jgi:ABC-type sugar transport system substrate-binding protein
VLRGLVVFLLGMTLVTAASGFSSDRSSTTKFPAHAANVSATGGVLCMPSLTNLGLVAKFISGYTQIAKVHGMTFDQKISNPQGDLNSATSNIQSCIDAKAKIIAGVAIQPAAVRTKIAAAKKAGAFYIADYGGDSVKGVDLNIISDDSAMSAQLVQYAKKSLANHQKLDIFAMTASPLAVVRRRMGSFLADARKQGWKISGTTEINLTDPAGSATRAVAAALARDPKINVIASPWDDPTAGIVAALREAGNSKVKVLSYEGLEPTLALMRAGKSPVVAIAGAPESVLNDLRAYEIDKMLKGTFKGTVNAPCVGELITNKNIPATGQELPGGGCKLNGVSYSAAKLKALARGKR